MNKFMKRLPYHEWMLLALVAAPFVAILVLIGYLIGVRLG
jgi:hypothetical protein